MMMIMVIDLLYEIIVEPLLWSLFVFFGLMTIVNAIRKEAITTKRYAVITSVFVFLITISDDILRMVVQYSSF